MAMSLALSRSISTSRHIETQGLNLRRYVPTPIPQKKTKRDRPNATKLGGYWSRFIKLIM